MDLNLFFSLRRLCVVTTMVGATSVVCGGCGSDSGSGGAAPADGSTPAGDGGLTANSDAQPGSKGGGAAVPDEAVAAGCPSQVTTVAAAFPAASIVRTSQGSAFRPDLTGGDLADGTYFLVDREMGGSGSIPSREAAVLVIKGSQLEYLDSQASASAASGYAESASAGPVVSKGTSLDTSGMKQCWGTESLPKNVGYSASTRIITLRIGVVDYSFQKP